MSKKCKQCGEVKSLSAFYRHKGMADGRLNHCKPCVKDRVRSNRAEKVDYYREYDKKRGNRQTADDLRKYREKYPNKYRAHAIVQRAIRAKKLFAEPCEVCGVNEYVHAHHDDYAKPLNVRWLCAAHHSHWHKKHGEALNAF